MLPGILGQQSGLLRWLHATAGPAEDYPATGSPGSRKWVILIFAFAALLYLAGGSCHWRIGTDSGLFVYLARSVATGRGYGLGVPPVVPMCLALVYKTGHAIEPGMSVLDTFLYFNAFEALVGFVGLVAAFFLIAEIASARRVALVLLLLATSYTYYSLSLEPLTDIPYCAVSWAAIMFLLRGERAAPLPNRPAAAVFLALAPLTRTIGASLVLVAAVVYAARALRAHSRRQRNAANLLVVLPALVTTVGMTFFILKTAGDSWKWSYLRDITQIAPGGMTRQVASNLSILPARLFAAVMGRGNITAPGVFLAVVLAIGTVSCWRRRVSGLVIGYTLVYVLFLLVPNYRLSARYLAPILPFVYLFLVEGLIVAWGWVIRVLPRREGAPARWRDALRPAAPIAAALALAAVIVANLISVAAALAPRFSSDFYKTYQKGYYRDYLDLVPWLSANPPRGTVMARRCRLINALCDLRAVQPPYHQFVGHRPNLEEASEYVRARDVAAIVVDPRNAESAQVFQGLIDNGPFAWRKEAQFGVLTVYVREDAPS